MTATRRLAAILAVDLNGYSTPNGRVEAREGRATTNQQPQEWMLCAVTCTDRAMRW
jgi:hypothetical protein